jgi:hypothetical protein
LAGVSRWYFACLRKAWNSRRNYKFYHQPNPKTKLRARNQDMQPSDDPRKRPLLTPEQLKVIRRAPKRTKKGSPREEFEKLFRLFTPAVQ